MPAFASNGGDQKQKAQRQSTPSKASEGSSSNPVVASLSKRTHPYSAVRLSPCRLYAVTACKDTLQFLKIGPTGLRTIKTVATTQLGFANSTHTRRTAAAGNLNLRDFAFGQKAVQQQQQQAPKAAMINVVITDVAWSSGKQRQTPTNTSIDQEAEHYTPSTNEQLIAAAGSNGTIVIWDAKSLLDQPQSPGQVNSTLLPEAVLTQHTRAVNRLSWHPTRHAVLLSASQDGTVLLWERQRKNQTLTDTTAKEKRGFFGLNTSKEHISLNYKWSCRCTFHPKSEAVRDIRWSPFYHDVFGLVTASGSLIVYDKRIPAHALVKMTAHSSDAITLDWHPTRPNIVATGGASDRCVKVWNLESELSLNGNSSLRGKPVSREDSGGTIDRQNTLNSRCDSVATQDSSATESIGRSKANRASTFMPSIGHTNTSRHKSNPKNMLHVLSISASVTRLRWRPPANGTWQHGVEDRHDSMMAVATAPITGASAGGSGVLSLWSYNRPYMPLSVLEGHNEGAVTDFDWLDTPQQNSSTGNISNMQQQASLDTSLRRSRARGQDRLDSSTGSRLPGASHAHEIDAILYDNSEQDESRNRPAGIWQHVLSVGRDSRCLVQSFARGDRPISRVPPSCFAMANLSPFQQGFGSLQLFSVCQTVPAGPINDLLLTGLRKDEVTTNAAGIFCEIPTEQMDSKKLPPPIEWNTASRLPESPPTLMFNIVDQGALDNNANPIQRADNRTLMVAPEVVHLSRFADRYRFYQDDRFPSRVDLCHHNATVAESLAQISLEYMWSMLASILESAEVNGVPTSSSSSNNVMQHVITPTLTALLEERAEAGDVQTCVAICEVFEVVRSDQTLRLPDLEISLVREWYLSYIDLLRDMCLFTEATHIIKSCKDPMIGALNQQSTSFHESCPHCGKPLLHEDNAVLAGDNSFARRACRSCRKRIGFCFLCHEPVKGVYVWCPGCGHGGHLEHAIEWFGGANGKPIREVCPTGCGHRCNFVKEVRAFPKTQSMYHLQLGEYCQSVSQTEE